MDFSMKSLIANVMLDIENYLSYVDDFEKPNIRYFNFVLIKLGLMHIFLYKTRIFKGKSFIIIKFIDSTLIALKKKFIEEKSSLRKSALMFLISKIYFTDDVATNLKLRVIKEEWEEFLNFFNSVKFDEEYQDVCIIFCHLYTENFFRFTMKSTPLALDYGENQQTSAYDVSSTTTFWNELSSDIKKLDQVDVEELKQLGDIRSQAIQPFEETLPEVVNISEIFDEFGDIEQTVVKFKESGAAKKSRKEVLQVCRDYLKTNSGFNSKIIDDEITSIETYVESFKKSTDKKAGSSSRSSIKKIKKSNSSDSESEMDKLNNFYK